MLVDLCVFVEGRFGEGGPGPDQLVPPPGHLLIANVVEVVGSFKGLDDSLLGLGVLPFDHFVDLPELVFDLLHDEPVLLI